MEISNNERIMEHYGNNGLFESKADYLQPAGRYSEHSKRNSRGLHLLFLSAAIVERQLSDHA